MPKSDQGINHQNYKVIPRTLIFLFDRKNRVLLIKGSPTKRLWAGLYNGIGGHVKSGEDILESAYRELREEAGIKNVLLRLCAQIMVEVSPQVGVAIFVFKGEYPNEIFTSSSEGSLSWVNMNELHKMPLVEDLPLLIPKVFAHEPTSSVMIGKYVYGVDGDLKVLLH
jgi:8-oxo-dGTP diphosphatase